MPQYDWDSSGGGRPHPEGEIYDPDGYNSAVSWYWGLWLVIGGGLALMAISALSGAFDLVGCFFAAIFIVGIPAQIIYGIVSRSHAASVAREKERRQRTMERRQRTMSSSIEEANARTRQANKMLEEQKQLMKNLQNASKMGDVIINGNHAPVFVSSSVVNSFNTIASADPELASAIKMIGGLVEESQNEEAAEFFNELHEEIADGGQNSTIIKALWQGLVTVLPEVESLTDAAIKIKSLFGEAA